MNYELTISCKPGQAISLTKSSCDGLHFNRGLEVLYRQLQDYERVNFFREPGSLGCS